MILVLRDAIKIKSKKVVYEQGSNVRDSATTNFLKELSDKRKVIEESIDRRSCFIESISGEIGGPSYQTEEDIQKLEKYLPQLAYLLSYTESLPKSPKSKSWISDLKIQWTSALTSCYIRIGGPTYFRVDNLRFELGMSLFLLGAVLRERAFETLSIGDLIGSATLLRKAAGVYSHLAEQVLPPLNYHLPWENPVEAHPSLSSIMSIICLADAQAIGIKRAEEKGNCNLVLSKLHYGVTQILDAAASILTAKLKELDDLSSRVKEIVSTCKVLHNLRSQMHLADDLRSKEQIGLAILVLRQAISTLKKVAKPRVESYCSVFSKEYKNAAEMLRKFESENDFVWHERVPGLNMLPTLQGAKIVTAVPFQIQKWEGAPISFII